MRRSVGAYAVVLVVLATVVGCSDDDSGARDPVTTTATGSGSTPTTDAGSTGPEVEAGTSKDWACPEVAAVEAPAQVRCVQVTVAERTGVDGGGPVVLPVAVVTHPGQSAATPLVYLDGGPGGDAIGVTADLAALPFAAGRPVVVIGQRGTPFAQPSLDCPEIEKSEIGQLDDALDDATDAAYLDAVGARFDRVQAVGGPRHLRHAGGRRPRVRPARPGLRHVGRPRHLVRHHPGARAAAPTPGSDPKRRPRLGLSTRRGVLRHAPGRGPTGDAGGGGGLRRGPGVRAHLPHDARAARPPLRQARSDAVRRNLERSGDRRPGHRPLGRDPIGPGPLRGHAQPGHHRPPTRAAGLAGNRTPTPDWFTEEPRGGGEAGTVDRAR